MRCSTQHSLPITATYSLVMKLLIVLSLIAYGYAAKLDRTYLPPANAATAGGSPGSLTAPGQGLSFGQQAPGFRGSQAQPGRTGFGASQPSGPSGFGQTGPSQASGFGQISGQAGTGQSAGFGQTGQTGLGQGPNQPSSYGQPSGTGVQPPNFGQPGFGQGQVNQGFAGQSQQPERPQAAADRNAEILRYDNQIDGDNFAYNFDTSNGISAEESGVATNGVQAQGEYSYTGDDGQFYKITYTADENGYVPQGDHLPTAPPIPEEIQRSIEENARAAAAGTQEGAYNPDEDNAPQQPSYNQGQGQQQFRGSNGFVPSGSTGQAQTRPQGTGFQGSSQPGFNQPQTFNQGSSQPAFNAQSGNQQTFSGQNRPQGKIGGQAQGQDGYDYSRPQNQGRQPNGNANFIPSGPSTTPGAQNQGRPFQQGQNQLSQSGSFGPSKSNEVQYQPPAFNQPQRQPSGNQGFGSSGAQFNKGSQGATQRNQPSANQGVGSLFNQNQGLAPTGSQSIQGSPSFPQNRPTSNNQQSQQGFQSQRGSQGSQVQRGLGGAQNQDGYEYNRPQGTFNSGSQGQVRPQSQSPVGSGAQGGFPGAGPKGQSGFSSSTGLTRPGSGPQGQPQAGFPGSSVANRPGSAPGPQFSGAKDAALPQFGGQPQRPGSKQPNNPLVNQTFNQQRQETFGGPRQQPSFSQEEGYKY